MSCTRSKLARALSLLGLATSICAAETLAPTADALHFDAAQTVAVAGTRFEIIGVDGQVLPQAKLVGAVLAVQDSSGRSAEIRIESVMSDPRDDEGEVVLYGLTTRATPESEWRSFCTPGPDGLALGFPVSGIWTARGEHERAPGTFSLTCTSGVIGKCVRMGYKYWRTEENGAPMWALHQACTRMLRADYCGDGRSHTRDGTVVNVYDRFGIQQPDPEPSRFEATWAADGALCVQRTRVPEVATLEAVIGACPERLATQSGEACASVAEFDDWRALLANRS